MLQLEQLFPFFVFGIIPIGDVTRGNEGPVDIATSMARRQRSAVGVGKVETRLLALGLERINGARGRVQRLIDECAFGHRTVAPDIAGIGQATHIDIRLIVHGDIQLVARLSLHLDAVFRTESRVAFGQTLSQRLRVPVHSISDKSVGVDIVQENRLGRSDFCHILAGQGRRVPSVGLSRLSDGLADDVVDFIGRQRIVVDPQVVDETIHQWHVFQ